MLTPECCVRARPAWLAACFRAHAPFLTISHSHGSHQSPGRLAARRVADVQPPLGGASFSGERGGGDYTSQRPRRLEKGLGRRKRGVFRGKRRLWREKERERRRWRTLNLHWKFRDNNRKARSNFEKSTQSW